MNYEWDQDRERLQVTGESNGEPFGFFVDVRRQVTHHFRQLSLPTDGRTVPDDDPRSGKDRECDGCQKTGGWTGKLKRWARGGAGILKKELGIGTVAEEERAARQAICEACPHGCYNFGVCDEDKGGCGCLLPVKVTLEGEECPYGEW